MALFTLAQLKLRSRERGDMVNSRFISETELSSYINASVSELYDLLIATRGENYYINSSLISTVSGVAIYSLPSDFLKLMGVDCIIANNQAVDMKEFNWKERNIPYDSAFINTRYQLRGGSIALMPVPSNVQSIKVWYIPKPATLVVDADSFEGINGWEEYIIIDVAIKMRVKEESPVQELMMAKQDMKARIQQASVGRDSINPPRVQDVSGGGREWI